VIIALDGLAPQGGEPQIWFIRDLSTGLTLRSGWLAQLDQPTFEAFLAPLKHLEWPILAVLSAESRRATRRRRCGLQAGTAPNRARASGRRAPAGTPEATRPRGRLDRDRPGAQPCGRAHGTGWPTPSAHCRTQDIAP
jgi:hypothetical protein